MKRLVMMLMLASCTERPSGGEENAHEQYKVCEKTCRLIGMQVVGMDFRVSGSGGGYDTCRCHGQGGPPR